jgi:manganese oxidase
MLNVFKIKMNGAANKLFVCSAVVFILSGSIFAQSTKYFNIYLRSNFGSDTMWDGTEVPIYSINKSLSAEPSTPARVLYCNEGDSVVLNVLSIAQGEHHTIHLHGLDVDTRNDGDPMTSFWLEHMQDTTYSFKATHAGTYIYHCHVADVVHVQMGMYGLIVVKAANGANTAWTGGPSFDHDVHWLTSELDSSWHFNIPQHNSLVDTVNIPPYKPSYFLVNGKSEWQLDNNDSVRIRGMAGEKIYVRLANIGFYNNVVVFPSSVGAQIIDSDGRSLANAVASDTVYVQPGERFGVMLSPTSEMSDSIPIHFVNMNTGVTENTQWAPLIINDGVGTHQKMIENELRIFPNPSDDKIFIENCSGLFIEGFSIINSEGKKLKSENKSVMSVDVQDLQPGFYIVELRTARGNFHCRFIRQ